MKVLKKIISAILIGALLTMAVACKDSAKDDFSKETTADPSAETADSDIDIGSKTNGILVMGTNAFFPPFEYYEGEEIVGIDAELMQAIADELGVQLEIVNMEFESLPNALSSGQIDVIAAGFTINPDRQETMDFTTPYYNATQTIIVLSDSGLATLDDITDKVIGVQTGTTGYDCALEITDESNICSFDNGMMAVEALKNGQVDAVIIDNNPAKTYEKENPDDLMLIEGAFDEEQYAMAVVKGSTTLQDNINTALAAIIEDGTYDEIIGKYVE